MAFAAAEAASAQSCRAGANEAPEQPLKHGATFIGRVIYVGDGRTLCIDVARRNHGLHSRNWVEVEIANSPAPLMNEPGGPAARTRLERVALGRPVVCVAEKTRRELVVATCKMRGRDLGDVMRADGDRD